MNYDITLTSKPTAARLFRALAREVDARVTESIPFDSQLRGGVELDGVVRHGRRRRASRRKRADAIKLVSSAGVAHVTELGGRITDAKLDRGGRRQQNIATRTPSQASDERRPVQRVPRTRAERVRRVTRMHMTGRVRIRAEHRTEVAGA